MNANVAGTDRSQEGVGHGVQSGVRVRMSSQALVMWDGNAAQHDVITGTEPVGVDTVSDPNVAKSRGERRRRVPMTPDERAWQEFVAELL